MLQSITWQEFFWSFAILVVIYYGATVIILNKDILSLFKNRTSETGDFPKLTIVMGSIKPDVGMKPLSKSDDTMLPEEIQVAEALSESTNEESSKVSDETLLLETISLLLQEIKTVFEFITENKSTKEEAVAFLKTLLSRYTPLKNSRYQNAIDQYILTEANRVEQIRLQLSEIEQLWS